MTDDEFMRAFHKGELHEFHHRDHVRLTCLVLDRRGVENAGVEIASGIRSFAAHHGQSTKYHETITQFWVRLVHHAKSAHAHSNFEELLTAVPHLLDSSLPRRHWSEELLTSPAARESWQEPDLAPLPWAA